MTDSELFDLLEQARVATLATIRSDGRVDLVPVTFAFDDDVIVTAVDWGALWWVRVRGRARVHQSGPEWEHAIELLAKRYPQYREQRPVGAAIVVERTELTGWTAAGRG
jgi:hypothetical protein